MFAMALRRYDGWLGFFMVMLSVCLLLFNVASAQQKPSASLAPLKINASVPKSNHKLLARLDIAKRLREALVDSRRFAIYSRDSVELRETIQRERELGESGLAKSEQAPDYRYKLTSYFFAPEVVRFSAYSKFSPIPYIEGIYDRTDVGIMSLRVAVLGADGEVLFEETGRDSFNNKYEYESQQHPKGGRPVFSRLEKMADQVVHQVMNALDARLNPITIYDRHGDTIMLNRGRNSGFKKGTKLLVFASPKEWTNPNTGETRLLPGRQVGEVQITRIDEEVSEAKVITDNGIEPNHILRIK